MKILTTLAAIICSCTFVFAQQNELNNAAVAYDSAQYQQSIQLYEQVAEQFGTSPELYYNLGGAYFKDKQYPKAILNYERCLLLDPSHADARVNLELAQLQCTDKIEPLRPMIFTVWSRTLRDTMSCSAWANWAVVLFLIFIAGLAAYFFVRNTAVRKVGFYSAIGCLLLCFVCINYAGQQKERLSIRDNAIVMAPSVIVRSSPADSGTQLFTIHEGLKVRIRSTLSGWSEVELQDGNVGWLPSQALEVI